jgi:hypothetical protein
MFIIKPKISAFYQLLKTFSGKSGKKWEKVFCFGKKSLILLIEILTHDLCNALNFMFFLDIKQIYDQFYRRLFM